MSKSCKEHFCSPLFAVLFGRKQMHVMSYKTKQVKTTITAEMTCVMQSSKWAVTAQTVQLQNQSDDMEELGKVITHFQTVLWTLC